MPTKTGKTPRLHQQGHNCWNGFDNNEEGTKMNAQTNITNNVTNGGGMNK